MFRQGLSDPGRTALNIAGSLVAGALMGILGFLTWALVFREIPAANETVLNILLGILSAQISLVVGFFFGSTVTTKRQTETIDTLAQTAKRAGEELAPIKSVPDLELEPGQTATVKAEDDR